MYKLGVCFLAMERKLEELRRESYIILWVIQSMMKIVTLSLSSLSLSFGYATCNMRPQTGREVLQGNRTAQMRIPGAALSLYAIARKPS